MEKPKSVVPERYDPVTYWNERAHPNTAPNPGVSAEHARFFQKQIAGQKSLLELGPGVGRLFGLYRGLQEVATLDLTQRYAAQVRAAADALGLGVTQNFLSDPLAAFPFAEARFDVGISSFVFIHVPFENIRHSMSELARVARKVVVFVGDDPVWPRTPAERKPSSHCFGHDYDALCDEIGCVITDREIFVNPKGQRAIGFVYRRL